MAVGVAAVVGVGAAVALVTGTGQPEPGLAAVDGRRPEAAARRFVRALLRWCLILLPEYAVIVLVLGAFRGWVLGLSRIQQGGLLIVVLAAVVGTLLVIPTAGEIPILQGLALLGVSSGTLGALLITLPAVSIPGAVMVARSFGWKAVATATVVVIGAGLVGATVLSAL
jgi:uncharacterized membrane protein YraQ (UPF0718 family)